MMFKQYLTTVRTYFRFGVVQPSIMLVLIATALLRMVCLLSLPFIASEVVDEIVENDFERAEMLAGMFLLVGLLYVLFRHLYLRTSLKHYRHAHHQFQKLMLEKVANFNDSYAEEFPAAFVTNAAFASISYAPEFLVQLVNLAVDLIALVLSCILLVLFDLPIGAATIAFVVIGLLALAYNLHHFEHFARLQLRQQDQAADLMDEIIDGRREVKVFNLRSQLDQILAENQALRRDYYDQKGRFRNRARITIPAFLGVGRICVYLLAIALILSDNHYNVAALVLAVGYYANIETYFTNIRQNFIELSNNAVHVRRIRQILTHRTGHVARGGNYDRADVNGKLELVDLSFTYHRRQLLSNINLTIKPHRLVLIVGKTGAGKSALFKLILRFYKPTHGKILLDDVNIARYTHNAYATNVAMAAQKPFIFDLSIRENLNMIDSNPSHQVEVCKAVGLHTAIMKLPHGYNTKLAAGANDFNAGQKQLFALARTLLTGSEVLLFDEITAELDVKTSKRIFEILRKLKEDHTIIAITHKPYLMEMADEIIVLDKGKIVGRGKHGELVKKNGYYRELYRAG